ncbi:MAG: hypothetical protein AAF581_22945 [Planctomycetota bacterium]
MRLHLHLQILSAIIASSLFTATASAQLPGNYTLTVADASVLVNETVTVQVTLDSGGPIDAWRYGVCNNATIASVQSVTPGATTMTANNGGPPTFYTPTLFANGFHVGVVLDIFGGISLPAGSGYTLDVATYDGLAAGTTNLTLCDTLGNPPISAWVVFGGVTEVPTKQHGSLTVTTSGQPAFVRGDCNDDGTFNIADAITALGVLFGGTATSDCDDACDSNNDGSFNIADAIAKLGALFSGGADPAAPFPMCGTETDVDTLTCDQFQNCP